MIVLDVPRLVAVSLVGVFIFHQYQTASAAHAARRSAREISEYRDRVIFSNWLA